jgi:hypothetical protein
VKPLAKHVASAKVVHPECVAQDGDHCAKRRGVLGDREEAAAFGRDVEEVEEGCAHAGDFARAGAVAASDREPPLRRRGVLRE